MPKLISLVFVISAFVSCTTDFVKYPAYEPRFTKPDSLIYQTVKKLSGSKKIKINGRKMIYLDSLFMSGLWVDIHYSYNGKTNLENDTALAKIIAFELKQELVDPDQFETFSINFIREEKYWLGTSKVTYNNYFDKNINAISAAKMAQMKPIKK